MDLDDVQRYFSYAGLEKVSKSKEFSQTGGGRATPIPYHRPYCRELRQKTTRIWPLNFEKKS